MSELGCLRTGNFKKFECNNLHGVGDVTQKGDNAIAAADRGLAADRITCNGSIACNSVDVADNIQIGSGSLLLLAGSMAATGTCALSHIHIIKEIYTNTVNVKDNGIAIKGNNVQTGLGASSNAPGRRRTRSRHR